ncbi:hypothetical protein PAPYR_4957 [Paratrimastix pyriformis]|uniref:CWH43-like N-terminal domain-containing protein n=1 Tax=Paratrimastix pyriformis TaxID=342808 RepID=A0ABQ8UNS3_9EUKA|nr:hypothetical protein PAPYR_4957 [Paratrimastix pyriformis]
MVPRNLHRTFSVTDLINALDAVASSPFRGAILSLNWVALVFGELTALFQSGMALFDLSTTPVIHNIMAASCTVCGAFYMFLVTSATVLFERWAYMCIWRITVSGLAVVSCCTTAFLQVIFCRIQRRSKASRVQTFPKATSCGATGHQEVEIVAQQVAAEEGDSTDKSPSGEADKEKDIVVVGGIVDMHLLMAPGIGLIATDASHNAIIPSPLSPIAHLAPSPIARLPAPTPAKPDTAPAHGGRERPTSFAHEHPYLYGGWGLCQYLYVMSVFGFLLSFTPDFSGVWVGSAPAP